MVLALWLLGCPDPVADRPAAEAPVDPPNTDATAWPEAVDAPLAMAEDADGDAFPDDVDCDDANPEVWPGAPEICGDGVENDCLGGGPPCRYTRGSSVWTAALQVTGDLPDRAELETAAGVGDVNGDGLDDVVFGGRWHSTNVTSDGGIYLFTGRTGRAVAGLDDATATIVGTSERQAIAGRLRRAGDVNGDGFDDVLVLNRLDAWVVPGPITGTGTIDDGTWLVGHDGDYMLEAASPGDLDGDGRDDIALWDQTWGEGAGRVYLLTDVASGRGSRSDAAATLSAGAGVHSFGWSMARAGDLTGDGAPDLVLGATDIPGTPPAASGVFVASYPGSGDVSSDDADAVLLGSEPWQFASTDLAGGTDVDGDGYGDLIIGCTTQYGDDGDGQYVAGFVVTGPIAGVHDLGDVAALTVVVLHGAEGYHGVGVAGPGDMDGDGFDEAVFGLSAANVLALFYGPAEGTVLYSDADALIWGPPGYGVGRPGSLDGGGDFDGDGLADLVTSALSYPPTPGGFVLLGSNF